MKPSSDEHPVQRVMRRYRPAEPDQDVLNQVEQQLMGQLARPAGGSRRLTLRRWMASGTALAACLALAMILFWPQGAVSFAAVQRQMERARTMQVRMRLEVRQRGGSPMQLATAQSWFDSAQGLRTDVRALDMLLVQSCVPGQGKALVVNHLDREVGQIEVDARSRQSLLQADPTALLAELRKVSKGNVQDLGQKAVGNVTAQGFGVAGPAVGMPSHAGVELWVDPRTKLPVQLACRYGREQGAQLAMIAEEFVWDQPVAPAVLALAAPESYKRYDLPAIPRPTEAALVAALKRFAQATGGQYPGGQGTWQLTAELALGLQLQAQAGGASEMPVMPREQRELLRGVFEGTWFFLELVRRGRDPEYFGHRVTQAQPQDVLMRWKLRDGQQRVIYGNLESATLAATEGKP